MENKKQNRQVSELNFKKELKLVNQYKEYSNDAWINATDRFSKIFDKESENIKMRQKSIHIEIIDEEFNLLEEDDIEQFQDLSHVNQTYTSKNLMEPFEQHLKALQSVDEFEKVFSGFFKQVENYKENLDQYIQTCMNRNLDGKDQKQTGEHQETLKRLTKEINIYLQGIKKAKISYAEEPTEENKYKLVTEIKKFLQAGCFNDFINFLTQAAKPVVSYVFGQNDTDEIKFAQTFKMLFEQFDSFKKIYFENDSELAIEIDSKKQKAMQITEDRVKLNGIILISKEFLKNFESLYLVVDAILDNHKELNFKNYPTITGLFGACAKLKNLQTNIEKYLEQIKNATDDFEKDTSVENLEKIANEIQAILNSNEIKEMISLIGPVTKDEKLTPDLMVQALESGKLGSQQKLEPEDKNKKNYIIESKTRFMQVVTRISLVTKDVVGKMEDMPKSGSTAHEKVAKALENIQPKISEVNDYPKLLEALLIAPTFILQVKIEKKEEKTKEIQQQNVVFNKSLENLFEKFSQLEKNSSANFYRQEILQAIQKIDEKIVIAINNFLSKSKLKTFFDKDGVANKILKKLDINSKQEIKDKIQCLENKFEILCELVKADSVEAFEKYIKEAIMLSEASDLIQQKEKNLSSGSNDSSSETIEDEIEGGFVDLFEKTSKQSTGDQKTTNNPNQQEETKQEESSNCQIF